MQPSLLAGALFNNQGNRLTPSHCTKGGKRYRYYSSQATLRSATGSGGVRRVPAAELESLVLRRLCTFLASGRAVLDAVGAPDDSAVIRKRLTVAGQGLAVGLPKAPASECRFVLHASYYEDHISRAMAQRDVLEADGAVLLGAPPAQEPRQPAPGSACA